MKKIAVFTALAVISGSLMAAPLDIRSDDYRPVQEGARHVQQSSQSGPQYNDAGARVNYKSSPAKKRVTKKAPKKVRKHAVKKQAAKKPVVKKQPVRQQPRTDAPR